MIRFVKFIPAMGALMISAAALAQPATAPSAAPLGESRIIRITRDSANPMQRVVLALNQAVVIELDRDVRDVVVANPKIADAVIRTPRRIFLMSLQVGQTNALFLDTQGVQIANLQISVGSEVGDLNRQIAQQLPGSRIRATALGSNIVLSGTAGSVQDAAKAQAMAQQFAAGAPSSTGATGGAGGGAAAGGGPAGAGAAGAAGAGGGNVINNIAIDQRQQVLIEVRVSEMSRAISKQLGINGLAVGTAGGMPVALLTDNQFSLTGRALSNMLASIGNPNIPPCLTAGVACPSQAAGVLQAMEQVGLVHTLAEPNLTAVSGESARFLAGGEFPVPASRDNQGNITVDYKQFGVGLAFTPVVLSAGRISLQISTEVSELTNTGAFTLNSGTSTSNNNGTTTTTTSPGLTLPALSVRRAETTVELPSGGSIAIGGLIQQQTKQNLNGLPGVKDLPVLGALFRSRDFQNNETELVVMVTAYLVKPAAPKMLAGPDDGFAAPSDLETTLLGRLNAVHGIDARPVTALDSKSLGYVIQ
ncbi:MAG TPA: type II and III secretion system protein family protein [Micropepsaceae bacterium]|nr:type II and III secretion system protein family protein [Micropepsaceae bacterium]